MIIPDEFQIFPHPVILSDKDCARLKPYLSHWMKLNQLLCLGVNEPDLERLMIIELSYNRRSDILGRLLSRWGRQRQMKLQEKIDRLLTL